MSRFIDTVTKVVFSVADHKDCRYASPQFASLPVGDSVPDSDPEPEGYAAMKLPEIKAEIERRNEGREDEDKISLAGNKPDLIAALEADDES